MRHAPFVRLLSSSLVAAIAALSCGGGGDGGSGPVAVASVEIASGSTPAAFQTLGRTAQFSATARDASGAAVAGASLTWLSSATSVATVSSTGLVTVTGNGTTQITASSGGVVSLPRTVTVAQVANAITVSTSSVAFGAIGSTRQLTGAVVDSGGAPVAGAAAVAWTRAGTGATASVSATGLATALAVGASDTAVASAAALTAQRVPISVTQVVASVLLTTSGSDTLRTTTRTKQYSAVPRDSQSNTVAGATVSWSSSSAGVATVGASTGLATAVSDGSTNIVATSSGISAQRALVVRRFASTFGMNPNAASITMPLGTQGFTATAQDSVGTNLPITWVSRNANVATVSPLTGTAVTATAAGNGTSQIVVSAGTRADSALLTVSGQSTAPLTAGVTVGDLFFRSNANATQNMAVDTIAVGGMVTWTWTTPTTHTVTATGSPTFGSSGNISSGTFQVTFNTAGSYAYLCSIHPSMTGTVVVR